VDNVVATVGTLLGFLVYVTTTMRTGNEFTNVVVDQFGLGAGRPALVIRIVEPVILRSDHNQHLLNSISH
jgi:hypothetical protein